MRYAIDVPGFGPLADARVLAEWAQAAERAGWDGFFIWDHIYAGQLAVVDTWGALTAIALATEHIKFGPMVTPMPRRKPVELARQTATLDRLSGGRLILGVGIGGGATEALVLGESPDAKTRFLPTPLQTPRIPVWVAAMWPNKPPFRRAAQWDGVAPLGATLGLGEMQTVDEVREFVAYLRQERQSEEPFDVSHWGISAGEDAARDAAMVEEYAQVGVTWWRENICPWRFGAKAGEEWPLEVMRERIRRGPPGRSA